MTSKLATGKHILKNHLHRRVVTQLVVLAVMSLVFFGIVLIDTFTENINPLWTLGGILFGLLIGLLAGRIFAMKWHEDTQKVIMSMDKTSFLLIGAYIVVRLFSERLFGSFLHGDVLTVVTFASLGGIMIGRVLGMAQRIKAVLRDQRII